MYFYGLVVPTEILAGSDLEKKMGKVWEMTQAGLELGYPWACKPDLLLGALVPP